MCAVLLLSLTGIPPLLGFLGKFLLFGAAISANQWWLALAGILNSAIALYYYVNLIRLMYFVAPERLEPVRSVWPLRVAFGVCVVATILLGLFPGPLLQVLRSAAAVAFV